MATVRKLKFQDRLFYIILYFLLCVFCFSTLYPFIYFLVLSLNDGQDALRGGIYLWPREFTLENYMKAFENPDIGNSFLISVARTGITTVLSVVLTALMAYGLSIKGLPGRKYIVFYFFFTTLFAGGLIPTFILYRQMGLLNNFWVFVIPGLFSFYNTIVTKTFFDGVPSSLSESARIDGASELIIFAKILLPLSMPVLATIALFLVFGYWNDWFQSSLYITDSRLLSLQALLNNMMRNLEYIANNPTVGVSLQQYRNSMPSESVRMAIAVVIVIPIACAYPFFQKYFISGLTIGAVKG